MTADENATSSRSPSDERDTELSRVLPSDEPGTGVWDATRGAVGFNDAAILARHADLTARDHVIGLEATVARLEYDLRAARKRVRRLRDRIEDAERELAAMRSSRTWKVGRMFTRPLGRLKG